MIHHSNARVRLHREVYGGTTVSSRSPLIGRSAQLQALQRLYERAALGESAMALLWGEAGVGKTRLLDEFSAQAVNAGARVGETACFESLCPPFAPIREAFAALGLSEPFAAQGAGKASSEHARHLSFSQALESLKAAAATPLLLVFDDLQWADFGTLEFLGFIAPRLRESQVLVMGAVRSEQLERDHARREALERLSRYGAVDLTVPPLDDDTMRHLIACIWPEGVSRQGEIERVCALAEGKPYFAEELVASAITARDRAVLDITPLSIRAGVLARFERLPLQQREVVLYASVIGRRFDAALLARVMKVSDATITAALSAARDLQLVREIRETPGAFTFRHAITREILYRELLALQTQAIHREIAEHLATSSNADFSDLAYHWRAAGNLERASAAYESAGDAAMRRNAHRDAEAAYRDAIASRGESASGYAPLLEKLSRVLSVNGEVDEACDVAERAVYAYESSGETELAASLAVRLARRIYESGRPEAAAAAAHQALKLSENRGPIAYDSYVTLAHFEALQGRNDRATAYLTSAQAAPGEHLAMHQRNAHMVRAIVAATSGRLLDAFTEYEVAVNTARELDDPEQLAWTLNNYASRAMATGWMERAREAHDDAQRCIPSKEFGKVGAGTVQGMAFASLLCGDLDDVRARQAEDSRLPPGIAMTQAARAALGIRLAYYAADDDEASRYATDETLEHAFESGEAQRIGLLAGCVAAYYDATGRRNEAAILRSRALGSIRTPDFSFWLLDQLATSTDARERESARALLAQAAADPGHLAAQAHLALFDARLARAQRKTSAKSLALIAADKFEAIGWPWERAQALELAGRHAQALDIYRRHGFLRHARDLEAKRRRARHRAGTDRLTPREAEIARLAAAGLSNRAIGERLFIGERTVETHIAAIFDRFDLSSRTQLGALLDSAREKVAAEPSS